MKVPSCVLWPLIKNHNSFLVKRGNAFTHDPTCHNNLHCASSSGLATHGSVGISLNKDKKGKGFSRAYHLKVKKNGNTKRVTNGPTVFKRKIRKVINNLGGMTERRRQQLLRRAQRLHNASLDPKVRKIKKAAKADS